MCTVSNIGTDFKDYWHDQYAPRVGTTVFDFNQISREEFDRLKKEVAELKKALIKAKLYDAETGQPDCEMEDKVELLKKIAEAVGVDLSEIFDK